MSSISAFNSMIIKDKINNLLPNSDKGEVYFSSLGMDTKSIISSSSSKINLKITTANKKSTVTFADDTFNILANISESMQSHRWNGGDSLIKFPSKIPKGTGQSHFKKNVTANLKSNNNEMITSTKSPTRHYSALSPNHNNSDENNKEGRPKKNAKTFKCIKKISTINESGCNLDD